MRLSELQNKDIVDLKTGERIGNLVDVEINEEGFINKLYIYNKKGILNILKNNDENYIDWSQIKKIGFDVILVDKSN